MIKNMFLQLNILQSMKSFLAAMLLSVSTVLLPLKPFIIIIILFTAADTLYAVYSTVKIKGWSHFTSHKFFNVFVKGFFFMGAVLLAFCVDTYFFEGSILDIKVLLTKIVSGLCIFNETKSISETMTKLTGKGLWDRFTEMITKAKSLKKDISGLIVDKKE